MKPYYDKNGITLYCADARDVLPLIDRADLLLTDPPYGIEGGRGANRARGKGNYLMQSWEDTKEYRNTVVLPIIKECLAKVQRGIITPGYKNMTAYPEPADVGCLYSPASLGRGEWGFNTFSPILYYGRDPRRGKGSWPTGKQVTFERRSIDWHPCPKPLEVWEWLMAKGSVDPQDVVLDPFVGSGTTLVAAQHLGRRAIGIEIEEQYCERIIRWLTQPSMTLDMPEEAAARAVQRELADIEKEEVRDSVAG